MKQNSYRIDLRLPKCILGHSWKKKLKKLEIVRPDFFFFPRRTISNNFQPSANDL